MNMILKLFVLSLVFIVISCTDNSINSYYSTHKITYYKDGTYKTYYKSGELKEQGNLIQGKKEGIVECYYSNGKLKKKEVYKNNQLEGLIISYDIDGEILMEQNYRNGMLEGLTTINGCYNNSNDIFSATKCKTKINFKNGKAISGECWRTIITRIMSINKEKIELSSKWTEAEIENFNNGLTVHSGACRFIK